ncbi:MAG TPA: type II secretion system F family protein [Candidatus Thermoplasmatota archaeon]|nr:type II secretion system F family protein [Candidatus Thermoplasmatota archaeon]
MKLPSLRRKETALPEEPAEAQGQGAAATQVVVAAPAPRAPDGVPTAPRVPDARENDAGVALSAARMNDFQRVSFRLFGGFVIERLDTNKLEEDIMRARMGVRAEAYMAFALFTALLCLVAGGLLSLFLSILLFPLLPIPQPLPLLLAVFIPVMMGLGAYGAILSTPASKAKGRGKDIDLKLPYALNYIAAMASAGVNVDRIFQSLAQQRIYGEVAREAEGIWRDIALYGKDSVTALKRAIRRSPSLRFQEFLQGAITTTGSGGDLQAYFSSKAQRYMLENRQEQRAFLDMMGLMAETYVTVAVAGPLFLIVMMSIMGMLSAQGPFQLYLVTYIMLPLANLGFVYGLMAMTPEL